MNELYRSLRKNLLTTSGLLVSGAILVAAEERELKEEEGLGTNVRLIDAHDGATVAHWAEDTALQQNSLVRIHAHTSKEDGAPTMPKLELHLPEGMVDGAQAKLVVDYTRGNGARPKRGTDADRVQLPIDGSFRGIEGAVWKIHQDPDWIEELAENGFFGGDATLSYRLPDQDVARIRLRIGGENPKDAICKEFIQSYPQASPGQRLDFMYAIARHESKAKNRDRVYYNQFLHLNSHPRDGGFPSWTNDGGLTPGGYGVFQVTGTAKDARANIRRDEIWNWQSNVSAAFRIMNHQFKDSLAERYFKKIRKTTPRADQLLENCPPPKIRAAGETFTAKQAVWITAYNGWGGFLKNRFVFQKNKPCGLGPSKRWNWKPPVKPSGKTYLELVAEELEH